jgi:uncharacterized protein (UPF0332 family)
MLSEKRIKEAETNIKQYLSDGLISKVKDKNLDIIKIYIKNAKESIKMSNVAIDENISPLWGTVCSYYAMFYSANALLYHYNYKVGDKIAHKITSDALIGLVRDKIKKELIENYKEIEEEAEELAQLKSDLLIENFDFERGKRNKYQYSISDEIKMSKSKTSLKRAKEFLYEVEQILNN